MCWDTGRQKSITVSIPWRDSMFSTHINKKNYKSIRGAWYSKSKPIRINVLPWTITKQIWANSYSIKVGSKRDHRRHRCRQSLIPTMLDGLHEIYFYVNLIDATLLYLSLGLSRSAINYQLSNIKWLHHHKKWITEMEEGVSNKVLFGPLQVFSS